VRLEFLDLIFMHVGGLDASNQTEPMTTTPFRALPDTIAGIAPQRMQRRSVLTTIAAIGRNHWGRENC
jgi:hypothetical protein